uniref:Mitotic checkpoint protein n=1 Tax=Romanomermis culicivorax TaxID=13658 RepID=A0A915I8T9_ROMCU
MYPMAVVGLANKAIKVYKLEGQPSEAKHLESPLKFQHRCISIFKDKTNTSPIGFGLGSIEGRVAIQYIPPDMAKDNNFTFKCHRSAEPVNGYLDIYAVNDIAFHPEYNTLATVGADGRFSFWDKDARTKLKMSEKMTQAITCCAFNHDGRAFAYAVGYDWSKGHEAYNAQEKNYIFIHPCYEDMKPRKK